MVKRNLRDVPEHVLYSNTRGLSILPISAVLASGTGGVSSQASAHVVSIERTGVGELTLNFPQSAPDGCWFFLQDDEGGTYTEASGTESAALQAVDGQLVLDRAGGDPSSETQLQGFLALRTTRPR
jgi:hypothetical protein